MITLLISMAFPTAIAQADEPQVLRVLCYNIHYGQGMDQVYDIPRLAKVIEKAKPDLVALQEVDVGVKRSGRLHEARLVADLTGLKVRFGPTQHYEGGLFGNAVLSRFPYEDVHIQPLPYTESTPERTTYPRAAISVIVRLPNNTQVRFISTHFQHNVPEDRVNEAKAINQFFDDRAIPTILAGDMNAKPDEEPIQILQQEWTNAIDEQKLPTAPSQNPRSRIDYIFYRGASLKMISSEVIDESMASDHRPVLAVFEISR
ncbi:endonuclease/exonuclease/phosphatase family protein [uncultured Rubinisphaera sp.]|uniref:endonuclease/exonuclease/phosphatase family protein n=2 Tax=Rubinisphaera TaxID=1649490 RepID=UPI0030DCDAFA